jgi:hypothetical protein
MVINGDLLGNYAFHALIYGNRFSFQRMNNKVNQRMNNKVKDELVLSTVWHCRGTQSSLGLCFFPLAVLLRGV